MSDSYALKVRRWHPKPFKPNPAPSNVRRARMGTVHPREWVCGIGCGMMFRYAHPGEIPPSACHVLNAVHEFITCPNELHKPYAICTVHSPSFSDGGG